MVLCNDRGTCTDQPVGEFGVVCAGSAIKSYITKTKFHVLHFCRRQYESYIHSITLTLLATKLPNSVQWRKITAITPFKVIQVTDFGTNQKLVCNFLLVMHRLQVIANYWSNFAFWQGVVQLWHSFEVNPWTQDWNSASLETTLYHTVWNVFWHTDGRTDRQNGLYKVHPQGLNYIRNVFINPSVSFWDICLDTAVKVQN